MDIKDNLKKYLGLKGIEIRIEKELPDSKKFDTDPDIYKPIVKQIMKEIKDQARSK